MSREESRLKRMPSLSVPSMKVLLIFLDLSLYETFEALVLELGLVARRSLVLLIAMPARKKRRRAAVVAAELEEANDVDAIDWLARLDSKRANGLATLVLCNVAPAKCCGIGSHLSAKLVVQMP
eukprot:3388821-Pleurochrysis_carterae.AAC.1